MKNVTPLEKIAERQFKKMAEKAGCTVRKFDSRKYDPDLIVLVPGGRTVFFEFKREGEKPRPGQLKRHEELRELGFTVFVSYTAEEAFQQLRLAVNR